jgi:hypothetical protein
MVLDHGIYWDVDQVRCSIREVRRDRWECEGLDPCQVSGWKAKDHHRCFLEDLKARLWMDHHQTPTLDDHLLMTWNVEQGKKEGILVAGTHGDQGGVPQGVVMREGSEGGKGMDLVLGGGMRKWVPEGAAGLRMQVGNRVRRRRSRAQQCRA